MDAAGSPPVRDETARAPLPVMVLDRVSAAVGWLGVAVSALCLLASLGLVAYGVAMRYLANRPVPWTDELVGYLLVAIVMLAAADALRRGEHIAVDVLTERLGERGKRLTAAFGLVSVLAAAAALVVEGWATAAFSRMLGIVSTGYLEMPIHLPQALIPLGGVMLGLAAVTALARMAAGLPPLDPPHHEP